MYSNSKYTYKLFYYLENEESLKKQYFIDPKGVIVNTIENMFMEVISIHHEIAHFLYPNLEYPEQKLMDEGYCEIGSSAHTQPIIHKIPTEEQIKTLTSLGKIKDLTILKDGYYINYVRNRSLLNL